MTLIEKIFYIWFYSGIVYSLYFLFIKSKTKEWEDKVRDLVWNTGFRDDEIYFVGLAICFIGGIYYIPLRLLKFIFGIKE